MTSPGDKAGRLHDLVRVLLDEEISQAEFNELSALLRDDSAAMQRYLAYISLESELAWECGRASTATEERRSGPAPSRKRRSGIVWGGVSAAVAAAILLVVIVALPRPSEMVPTQVRFSLLHLTGEVRVVDGNGLPINPVAGASISSDATVTTNGPASLAVLAYDDGTRVLVAGDSHVCFAGRKQKTVETLQGTISASVLPQPESRPLLVITPQASMEVLGTEFAVAATPEETDLRVMKGTVRLTRKRDGMSVVVAQGKRVEAGVALAELEVRDVPLPTTTWAEEFERGLPGDWQLGTFVNEDLPAGSRGAVQARFNREGQVYGIASAHPWLNGLFLIHSDSHLHITYKMERPDWINIFFITRTDDPGQPTTFLHKFSDLYTAKTDAGRWRKASIPFTRFQRKSDRGFEDVAPQVGELVFGLSCSAPEPDRGLVIDRMWVTRGGPGKVVVESVE